MFTVDALYQQHVVLYILRIRNIEQNILITLDYDCVWLLLTIKYLKIDKLSQPKKYFIMPVFLQFKYWNDVDNKTLIDLKAF